MKNIKFLFAQEAFDQYNVFIMKIYKLRKINIYILLVFMWLAGFSGRVCTATDIKDVSIDVGQTELIEIKQKISYLIMEHEQLLSEYEVAEQTYLALKTLADDRAQYESSFIFDEPMGQGKTLSPSGEIVIESVMREDPLLARSRRLYQEGVAADLDESSRLWDLELKQWDLHRRDLALEHNYRKFLYDEKVRQSTLVFDGIKAAVQENLRLENDLLFKLAQLEKEVENAPNRIRHLQHKNKDLKDSLEILERQKILQHKANKVLREKITLAQRRFELGALWKVEKNKVMLTREYNALKKTHEEMTRKVDASLEVKKNIKAHTAQLIEADQLNQQYRKQIKQLQNQIKTQQGEVLSQHLSSLE